MKQLGIGPLMNFYNRQEKNDVYHKVAGTLLQHMQELGDLTIQEAAELCYTSSATISRLAKKAGYDGFNALKEETKQSCANYFSENRILQPELLNDRDTTEAYLSAVIQMFTELSHKLEREKLEQTVDMIHEAEHIYYFGTCDNARRFQQDLFYAGKRVEVYQVFSMDTPQLLEWSENSLAIVENPGYPWFQSDDLILRVKEVGAKIVAITCAVHSAIEEQVDLAIHLSGTKSGRDEVLFNAVMNILSLEYRKRFIDTWYYSS